MDTLRNLIEGRNLFFRRSIYQFRNGRENITRLYLENERQILLALQRRTVEERPLTINIPIQAPAGFFDPIPVLPSAEDIESSIRRIERADGSVCAICQDAVVSGGSELVHCSHHFHDSCIRQWFETSVRCPVCRHDIRMGQATQTSPDATEMPTPQGTP